MLTKYSILSLFAKGKCVVVKFQKKPPFVKEVVSSKKTPEDFIYSKLHILNFTLNIIYVNTNGPLHFATNSLYSAHENSAEDQLSPRESSSVRHKDLPAFALSR